MGQFEETLKAMEMDWNKDGTIEIIPDESFPTPIASLRHLYMNREDGNLGMEKMLKEELILWIAGQKEYARSPNIFANFTRLAESLETTPEKILMVYATKHMDGIMSWINGHKSQREDVRGRINDLRVYLAILYLMVEAYEGKE